MTTRLSAGDRAPDFSLTDDRGESVSLADLRGRKAIVYVYPAALTPGCTTQACDFSDNLERLTGLGYAVVGVSPDAPEKLAHFREKENLTITLLSDPEKEMLREWGAFGEKKLYGKVVEGVIRSTVVLDEEGVVTHAWYNVKATGHVAKIMRDLGLDAE
jgi:thioredoxin-dependent peroxiredoxin